MTNTAIEPQAPNANEMRVVIYHWAAAQANLGNIADAVINADVVSSGAEACYWAYDLQDQVWINGLNDAALQAVYEEVLGWLETETDHDGLLTLECCLALENITSDYPESIEPGDQLYAWENANGDTDLQLNAHADGTATVFFGEDCHTSVKCPNVRMAVAEACDYIAAALVLRSEPTFSHDRDAKMAHMKQQRQPQVAAQCLPAISAAPSTMIPQRKVPAVPPPAIPIQRGKTKPSAPRLHTIRLRLPCARFLKPMMITPVMPKKPPCKPWQLRSPNCTTSTTSKHHQWCLRSAGTTHHPTRKTIMAKTTYTRDQVREAVQTALQLLAAKIRPMVPQQITRGGETVQCSMDAIRINVEHSFYVGGSLRFAANMWSLENGLTQQQVLDQAQAHAELNWGSTGRNIATAVASVQLYQQLINIGALLESSFRDALSDALYSLPAPDATTTIQVREPSVAMAGFDVWVLIQEPNKQPFVRMLQGFSTAAGVDNYVAKLQSLYPQATVNRSPEIR